MRCCGLPTRRAPRNDMRATSTGTRAGTPCANPGSTACARSRSTRTGPPFVSGESSTSSGSELAPLPRRYVLLAPDVLDRQAEFLQLRESGVDHVGVAAQVGDVVLRVGREFRQDVLHVAAAVAGTRRGACRAREAGMEGEFRVPVREGIEFLAVQELLLVARPVEQGKASAMLGDELLDARQHRAVWRDAGAGGDQEITPVGVVVHQAEASVRAAGLDLAAGLQVVEEPGRCAALYVRNREFQLPHLARRVRRRPDGITALGGFAVVVVEMDLDELAGRERERRAVGALEREVAHGRCEHAAVGES